MGFKKDDHVEELLRSVATALPNDPLHGWKILNERAAREKRSATTILTRASPCSTHPSSRDARAALFE